MAALAVGRIAVAAQDATPDAVQEASPVASPTPAADVNLLFVQTGGATTLTPGTGDIHTLTITGVTAQTLYFSDRPSRITGAMPTATFVGTWAEAFGDNPPNATLIGHPEAGGDTEEAVVVELLEPVYDAASATLTYQVRHPGGWTRSTNRIFEQEPLTVLDAPRQYAEAHLFIDDFDTSGICQYCDDTYQNTTEVSDSCQEACQSICDYCT